ncbi:acylneuraminate cytidylyltransferase family protein [Geomonas paludis]|uniref:Acylneuraminate cytidylyltransferase family protein n=1 Tax=Geomonas paludis TaxID=2740185 RepID=A0A6V8N2F6_9BACT|nr:acylneuraminate cytidylyltransferase family protein [Geomonas paludis]UPU36767.1 acylneuraminate cytidylyltransferase family protein [Geomonas paludis]GFO66057.1 posttranslational modification protein [Geomonas paludis]
MEVNRLCTICARGGSKGVKNKNIRELLGKPLIAYSLQQAIESGLFRTIAVSSDSDEILDIAGRWGAQHLIKRPDELATDQAAKIPAIRHCVREVERITGDTFTTLVDLDATSPLRFAEDIIGAVNLLETRGVSNVITGMNSRRSPYFNLVEADANGFVRLAKKLETPVVRRQDGPKCYDMNASVYVWRRDCMFESDSVFNADTLLYEMPEDRSIDIDSELDFQFVEFLMKTRGKE